ncbi:MAG: hypothetical protein VX726_11795 [Planctomycetota bacterium]|nr:hypothetical protein [Planctomycetota bacterium]
MGLFRSSCLLALIAASTAASPTFAQSNDNSWITPGGGFWNDPANWRLGFVPTSEDLAFFDLPIEVTVFATGGINAEGLILERGDVDIRGSRRFSPINFDAGIIVSSDEIGGQEGRLRFGGPGFVTTPLVLVGLDATQSAVSTAEFVAGTGAGMEIVTGGLGVTSYSTLRFEVNEQTPDLCPAAITVFDQVLAQGGFSVVGDGGFLREGDSFPLIDATGTRDNAMPEFGLVRSPATIDAEMIIEETTTGDLEALVIKAQRASSIAEFEPIQSFPPLTATPIDIVLLDLDDNGGDDAVLVMNDGKHLVFLRSGVGYQFEGFIESNPDCRAATTGDFDDDGDDDLAFASAVDTTGDGILQTLLELRLATFDHETGPAIFAEDVPVSLSPIRVRTSNLLASGPGVSVTTKNGTSGRGTTRGYETTASDLSKTGEEDVGEEPGPSDPIDDENKKDTEAPIGVGGTAQGLMAINVLNVLSPTSTGFEVDRRIQTSGRVVDFDSGDIDQDGRIETLVLTDANRIDLLRPREDSTVYGSVALRGGRALGLTIGDLGEDGRPEVLVVSEDGAGASRLDVYRIDTIALEDPKVGSPRRPYLEFQVRAGLPLDSPAANFNTTTGGLAPVSGVDANGLPKLEVLEYGRVGLSGCTVADLNGDGVVDADDLGLLFGFWGTCGGCPEDLNGDGRVNSIDVGILFSNWGPCS